MLSGVSVPVAGVRIDIRTPSGFIRDFDRLLADGGTHIVRFLPADPIARAGGDDTYQALLNDSALNVPDGMSVVWALRMLGHKAVRLSGTESMLAVMRAGAPRRMRHYLMGGTDPVLHRLRSELESRIDGVLIVGSESPPFAPVEAMDIGGAAERVRASRADVLWVGLGVPKQDIAASKLAQLDAAPVIACVGAAFDFISRERRRAPMWMRRAGLEWVHRLVLDPRRLWRRYLVGNGAFAWHVVRQMGARR